MRTKSYLKVFIDETTIRDLLLPAIANDITLNAPVASISPSGQGVRAHLADGRTLDGEAVILTSPISVLQSGQLALAPELAPPNVSALQDVTFGEGLKVFMTFRERFYPDVTLEGSRFDALADTWDSKIYYDAAFGKGIADNVLAHFNVAEGRLPLAEMSSASILAQTISELSTRFDLDLSDNLIDARVENWSQAPFIGGSYSMTNESDYWIAEILQPIDGRLFFAGEALGGENQSTVHGAAFSAIEAVERMLSA